MLSASIRDAKKWSQKSSVNADELLRVARDHFLAYRMLADSTTTQACDSPGAWFREGVPASLPWTWCRSRVHVPAPVRVWVSAVCGMPNSLID